MPEIERKALGLVAQLQEEDDGRKYSYAYHFEALCRAIEQHEAFRQEVSDAVEAVKSLWDARDWPSNDKFEALSRFIIAKPDPLVDAWLDAFPGNHIDDAREECAKISAALAARGLEVRKIGEGE